jgi:hypothetical protein
MKDKRKVSEILTELSEVVGLRALGLAFDEQGNLRGAYLCDDEETLEDILMTVEFNHPDYSVEQLFRESIIKEVRYE